MINIINPAISIPVSVAGIITGVLFIDVSSLQGILIFNIYISCVHAVMFFVYALVKFRRSGPGVHVQSI